MYPGSYFWWLHWQHRSRITGICVIAVCQRVTHQMKRLSIGLIEIRSHLAEVFV